MTAINTSIPFTAGSLYFDELNNKGDHQPDNAQVNRSVRPDYLNSQGMSERKAKLHDKNSKIASEANDALKRMGLALDIPTLFTSDLKNKNRLLEKTLDKLITTVTKKISALPMSDNNVIATDASRQGKINVDVTLLALEASTLLVSNQNIIAGGVKIQIKRDSVLVNKLRKSQVEKRLEQLKKGEDQVEKAKKAGIFSAVFDWISSAAEVVLGAIEIVGSFGMATAMGMASIAAGTAGFVKTLAEICLLAGVGDKKTLEKCIEVAGKVQLSFEIIGMCGAVGKMAMMAKEAWPTFKTTVSALKNGGTEKLLESLGKTKDLGKNIFELGDIIGTEAKQVVKSESKQLVECMAQELKQAEKKVVNQTAESIAKEATKQITDKAARSSTEELVAKSIKDVMAKGMKKGSQLSMEQLQSQLTSKIRSALLGEIWKSIKLYRLRNFILLGLKGVNNTTVNINKGFITDLEKQKDDLQISGNILKSLENLTNSGIEKNQETMKKSNELLQQTMKRYANTLSINAQLISSLG